MRHMPVPADNPPKQLRGVDLRVTFFVDEKGAVQRVTVDPPIADRKFADKFRETMLSYRFRPALGPDGLPVASSVVFTVSY